MYDLTFSESFVHCTLSILRTVSSVSFNNLFIYLLWDNVLNELILITLFFFYSFLIFPHVQPRRSRSTSPFVLPTSSAVVFRPDAIFVLLRKAYKDSDLGTVCRMVMFYSLRLVFISILLGDCQNSFGLSFS